MLDLSERRALRLAANCSCAGLILLLGCRGQTPQTVDVSGQVTIDGKPVAGVEVNFIGEKFAGFGKTDERGYYTLARGAAPGENKVFFRKIMDDAANKGSSATALDPEMRVLHERASGRTTSPIQDLIPPDYRDPATTKMTFDVPEGGTNEANFDLVNK